MSTATEQAGDFFMRLALSEDCLGYPLRVAVVATDIGNVAKHVWESIDQEDMPIIVIDADGGETLIARLSRLNRLFDRVLGRSCVRLERRVNGDRVAIRKRVDRATVERELLSA